MGMGNVPRGTFPMALGRMRIAPYHQRVHSLTGAQVHPLRTSWHPLDVNVGYHAAVDEPEVPH